MKALKGIDFFDFGASKKESIELGQKRFFGKRGMGIDLDPERVAQMNAAGLECMVGDLTDLDVPDNCVRFVKMSHILEHMPDVKGVEKAVASAKKAATDFLVITGPFFDEDEYLASLGLKLDWSDYPEHTCHLTITDMVKILDKLGLKDYDLHVRYLIRDSSSDRIHPLASPAGAHRYDPSIHPKKKQIVFEKKIWTDFVCYVPLKKNIPRWEEITHAYEQQIPFVHCRDGKKTITPDHLLNAFVEVYEQLHQQAMTIRSLKAQTKQLADASHKHKKELHNIQSSKAWRVTRKAQNVAGKLKRKG